MMLLKNAKDINLLLEAVKKCSGDIILRSANPDMPNEEFNLKSTLSQYMGIARLCEEHGDEYEIFCTNYNDTCYMMQFFHDLKEG